MLFGTNILEKVAYDFSTNVLVKFCRRYQSNLGIFKYYIYYIYKNLDKDTRN